MSAVILLIVTGIILCATEPSATLKVPEDSKVFKSVFTLKFDFM